MSVDNQDIIKPGEDFFSKIVDAATVEKAAKAPRKKATGRPKSKKTLEKEQSLRTKEFTENFESISDYRPEPKRLIEALSLPPEQHQAALEAALNPRQLAFCKEYVIDYHGGNAAARAGYTAKDTTQIAVNLLRYKGIRRLIEIYGESPVRKMTKIDPDFVISKVTEIVQTAAKDGDKLRGLELLARHLGMFVDRTEITGKDGGAIQMEETKKKADEVARQLRSMATRTSPLKLVK